MLSWTTSSMASAQASSRSRRDRYQDGRVSSFCVSGFSTACGDSYGYDMAAVSALWPLSNGVLVEHDR